jgi:radical SAM-linked protein
MVKIFFRAIRRAQIPVKHSEGFHPKPKISFGDSLPVGIESMSEWMYISIASDIDRQSIVDDLNKHLPDGLFINNCRPVSTGLKKDIATPTTYAVAVKKGLFDRDVVAHFLQKPEFFISRTNRKGKRKNIDLRSEVVRLEVLSSTHLQMTLNSSPGITIRPGEVLKSVFHISDFQIRCANIIKLEAISKM